jgi:hypothetical protein
MQTYFAVDFANKGLDECHMSLVEYVAPGVVHVIASTKAPDYATLCVKVALGETNVNHKERQTKCPTTKQ